MIFQDRSPVEGIAIRTAPVESTGEAEDVVGRLAHARADITFIDRDISRWSTEALRVALNGMLGNVVTAENSENGHIYGGAVVRTVYGIDKEGGARLASVDAADFFLEGRLRGQGIEEAMLAKALVSRPQYLGNAYRPSTLVLTDRYRTIDDQDYLTRLVSGGWDLLDDGIIGDTDVASLRLAGANYGRVDVNDAVRFAGWMNAIGATGFFAHDGADTFYQYRYGQYEGSLEGGEIPADGETRVWSFINPSGRRATNDFTGPAEPYLALSQVLTSTVHRS